MPLTLDGVSVQAPDDPARLLARDVDLELRDGTVTLLLGRTGSGKTTLLHVLAGIRKPSSGAVLLDGAPIWRNNRVNRPALLRLGATFQFPEQQLFARTVEGEFRYSLRPFGLAPAARQQRMLDVGSHFDRQGTLFRPDRSPFSLSGGEQRRLALATSFAAGGDWLMMDEPTAGLESAVAADLLRLIRERQRSAAGGTVIATHDLDAFLPLADRVIVLDEGTIAADATPEQICNDPRALIRTGVGLPSCVEVACAFARAGMPLPRGLLDADSAVLAIERMLATRSAHPKPAPETNCDGAPQEEEGESAPLRTSSHEGLQTAPMASRGYWHRLDPRAKWLAYVVYVAVAMLQQTWIGLAAAALPLCASFAGLPWSVLRGGYRFARPFLFFALLSILLAGFAGFGGAGALPIRFEPQQALATGFNVARLLLVTMASYWLSAVTPHGEMIQGLYWALKPAGKIKAPVETISLATTLLFRFLPLVLGEYQRFSTIVRARGKVSRPPGSVRMRDLPALVIPLLLSLFYKAEAITTGLEMRKTNGRLFLIRSNFLSWTRAETLFASVSLLIFALLLLLEYG